MILTACSSPVFDTADTEFKTRISASGLKHFHVSLRPQEVPMPLSANPAEIRRARFREEQRSQKFEQALHEAAKSHIERTQFCRTGYWVLDTHRYTPVLSLRGECNEAATEEDIARFPNTIVNW